MPGRALAALIAIGIAAVALLVWAPPIVSFATMIVAVVCWCIWLERHPGP
jgi:hypothetical protein